MAGTLDAPPGRSTSALLMALARGPSLPVAAPALAVHGLGTSTGAVTFTSGRAAGPG